MPRCSGGAAVVAGVCSVAATRLDGLGRHNHCTLSATSSRPAFNLDPRVPGSLVSPAPFSSSVAPQSRWPLAARESGHSRATLTSHHAHSLKDGSVAGHLFQGGVVAAAQLSPLILYSKLSPPTLIEKCECFHRRACNQPADVWSAIL